MPPARFEVHRAFDAAAPSAAADGLDLSSLDILRPDRRSEGAFTGPAADRINLGEAFFGDAVSVVRDGRLSLPNPFGPGRVETSDIVACPSTPWTTVPLYIARVGGHEPFAFVKRGLSWCTDLGLVFPRRRLFVSLQPDDRRLAQDIADLEHAEHWFSARRESAFEPTRDRIRSRPTMLLTSEHFAHHLWNELSVLDGLVDADVHRDVQVLVNQQPIAPIRTLFPEIPAAHIEIVSGSAEIAMEEASRRGWCVVPAGRRYVPEALVARLLRVARARHPEAAAAAAAFRARHALVLWLTLRLDARTATNLVEALIHLVSAARTRFAGLGVIVDGFTMPTGVDATWNHDLLAAERRALPDLQRGFGDLDQVALVGRANTEAFVWATAADYYVCPYGSAQHKVAWVQPIPGTVHAGENKRQVSGTDAGFYARQRGPAPSFFFSEVTRTDATVDPRTDLVSYALDIAAFTEAVLSDLEARVTVGLLRPGQTGEAALSSS